MESSSVAMALSAPPLVVQKEPQSGKHLKSQLAAAVRSINWSYAIFWSISSSYPGLLTWKEGFYNDEIKTMKIATSLEQTADQIIFQRSEQLRELYESLQSDRRDHRAARPIASLLPEDLGDIEWYYIICMTYAFRPSQGLPGRSFTSNEHVWLCNAYLADSKTFPRATLAKTASLQTIVCIPLSGGVLELGTTASVPEDPELLHRTTKSFMELKFPRCTEDPSARKPVDDNYNIVVDELDQDAMDTVISEGHELGEVDCLFGNKIEHMIMEFDDFCGPWEELDVHSSLQDSRCIMDDSSLAATTQLANKDDAALSRPGHSSLATSFVAWTRFQSDKDIMPVIGQAQKFLKKVVAGRAWTKDNDGESTARTTQESYFKNRVISERRRREKLSNMFQVLTSLVPTIGKMDKASILAETIAYINELEQKVKELESRRESISIPKEKRPRCHDSDITGKRVPAKAKRKKFSKINSDREMEQLLVLSKDDPRNIVNVSVTDKEVLLKVQCQWKELLLAQMFDTIKSLNLDFISVEASILNYQMVLKIRAQFASPNAVPPGIIGEALRRDIANHSRDS